MKHTTLKEAIGWLIIGIVVLYLAHMAGYLQTEPAHSAARPTPTACRAGVEGKNFCPDRFATSEARPNQHNRPVRATPTPKRGK